MLMLLTLSAKDKDWPGMQSAELRKDTVFVRKYFQKDDILALLQR